MKKNIGLFGLTFDSGNMGCCALAYSFYNYLNESDDINNIYLFAENSFDVQSIDPNIKITPIVYNLKNPKNIHKLLDYIEKCDIIFDFTEGDSFSDIYGTKRFLRVSITKMLSYKHGKCFVLGPQTFGPYSSKLAKAISKKIFDNSTYIFSRDAESANLVKTISSKNVEVCTDVAFALPYKKKYIVSNKKIIGINVSGLLWNGGYNGTNQFNLTVDYREYIIELIKKLLLNYDVHLIPHVITKNKNNIENDVSANNEIYSLFPDLTLAPEFRTPIEAKEYISSMNFFVGARMHATIASFSSGVVTIPFSYSKKFEGLYDNLNYPYVIHGTQANTEYAVRKTLEYINNSEDLIKCQKESMCLIEEKLEKFEKSINSIINMEIQDD